MSGVVQSRLPTDGGYGTVLPTTRPTLAETLASAGVSCAGWHCNPHTTAARGFDRGFDVYADLVEDPALNTPGEDADDGESPVTPASLKHRVKRVADALHVRQVVDRAAELLKRSGLLTVDPRVPAETLVDAFETWLAETSPDRRFAYLHFMDTHMPYQPPDHHWDRSQFERISPGRAQRLYQRLMDDDHDLADGELADLRLLYRAEAEYVDAQLAHLVSVLERRDAWDSTLLVFTADHGELFGERRAPDGSTTGHPSYLCEAVAHVPLVLAGGPVRSVQKSSPVSGVDLAPTVTGVFDVPVPPAWNGIPLWEDGRDVVTSTVASPPDDRADTVDTGHVHAAVRDAERAVLWWAGDRPTEYYRRTDHGESEIADPDDGEFGALLDAASSHRLSVESSEEETAAVAEQRLEDLGYLG